MQVPGPWLPGRLRRRYKRFLADVELEDGSLVTAHTPNTGSLKGCAEPGMRVWLRDTRDSKRKYPYSWELVEARPGTWVGIHTGLSNHLVREGIETGLISPLQAYERIRSEVPYGNRSRIDLLLEASDKPSCYVEVKNVTLAAHGVARFPDAVSVRASKHLNELVEVMVRGGRAMMVFCVQRADVTAFTPADDIDPDYGKNLRQALAAGVEALAFRARVGPGAICLDRPIPIICH
ncbi:MAG: DNA/RNA nuclease SfsA [Methylothermaceae bacterium]|nr:DNA/RNA nuclease SfsA [Methylothermaceae bacterium]